MEGSIFLMILLQVVLIGLNAFFACAEIALISINESKVEKLASEGDKRAIRLTSLTKQPARFLATIQVAITLSGFLGSAFAAENFSDRVVDFIIGLGVNISPSTLDGIVVVGITLILSYFTLVFGELVPKQIAMRNAETLALAMSSFITGIANLFSPVVWFLTVSTNAILRLIGIDPNKTEEIISEEDIRMMVDVGSKKGSIDHEEKQFIENVFEFDDLTAREISLHRTDIALLWMEESMDEWEKTIYDNRHTLYPVCDGSADNIIGILNAKDYFRLALKSRENVMKEAVKPAYFVPESVKADVLFRNMKRSHNTMAVVLDEYGGMIGIVTITDLVEQLVGDLGEDEPIENEEPLIERVDAKTWKIHGDALLSDVERELNIKLPCEEYDTFNGLIFCALETIPDDGTIAKVKTAGLIIKIIEIRNHQVEKALVSLENNRSD